MTLMRITWKAAGLALAAALLAAECAMIPAEASALAPAAPAAAPSNGGLLTGTVYVCVDTANEGKMYVELGHPALDNCAAGYLQFTANQAAAAAVADVVTVINPGAQVNNPGAGVNLPLSASSSEGHPVTSWVATGLPPGLSVNTSTGVISGTIGSGDTGTYVVTVTATDSGSTAGIAVFDWTVT